MKEHIFHVNGMHCKSCVILIESELRDLPEVSKIKADLGKRTVKVEGDFGTANDAEIAEKLSRIIEGRGYTLSVERTSHEAKWGEFAYAIPAAILFLAFFFLLQKLGIVNLVDGGDVSYGTAFLVGVVASLSTCMAVVGGLVLSMSATFAKEGDRFRPQALFHVGRLISFFVLGGTIGVLGSAFQLSTSASFALGLVIGIVMLILGINLLDVFHFAKKFQLAMPKSLAKRAFAVSEFNHTFTPFLVGAATFFFPCGFTQSMQIYTLSTGNFLKGGLTMFSFALGTLPVLAALSFSSWNITKSGKSGIFFKTAGIVVILFAVFNIINSLVVIGIMRPVFNF